MVRVTTKQTLELLKSKSALSIALLLIFAIAFFVYFRGQDVWTPDRQFLVLFSILAAAVIVTVVECFPGAVRWLERWHENRLFLDFFGEVTQETRGALLLFGYRKLRDGLRHRDVWDALPEIDQKASFDASAEGLGSWVTAQDLRGANYVAGELAKVVRQTSYFGTDRDLAADPLDQIRATVISFGLGLNQFTHRIVTCTGGNLFSIGFSQGYRDDIITDNISIPGIGDAVTGTDGTDLAIIARVPHPLPRGAPSRYFFVCAGRTASGTAVAGQYLASNWKQLLRLYRRGDDGKAKNLETDALLVVIAHRYHTQDSEDDAGGIAYHDGKPLIRWWQTRDDHHEVRPAQIAPVMGPPPPDP